MATVVQRGPCQWQAKVRRKGYPIQSKTFDSKREAEAWVTIVESEMVRSVFVDRSLSEKTTFKDVIEHYIREVAPGHKGVQAETLRLRRFTKAEPGLACRVMATLRPEDFEAHRDRRLQEVKPSTLKRELGLLHAVIQSQVRRLGLIENPISHVKRPTVRDSRDRRFQGDEEARLMGAIDEYTRNPWLKPVVVLALETAMRRGEILAMRWEHVNLERQFVHLPDSKTGEARDVPLSSRAVAVLKNLPRSLDGQVFPKSAESVKQAFERAREKAEMRDFHFHDLRHEATSRLFERGWNIMEVAAVTGHKDLQSLKRYTNLKAEDLAKKMG